MGVSSNKMRKQASRDPEPHHTSSMSSLPLTNISDRNSKGGRKQGFHITFLRYYYQIRNRPVQSGLIGIFLVGAFLVAATATPKHKISSSKMSAGSSFYPRIILLPDGDFKRVSSSSIPSPRSNAVRLKNPINAELPLSDKEYERSRIVPESETTECAFIDEWQITRAFRPTCVIQHEVGMQVVGGSVETIAHLASGGFKDVWRVYTDADLQHATEYVLKTQLYENSFKEKEFDKHRRDAIVTERNSASPYILNMYSYCGYSSLVESAPETMDDWLDDDSLTSFDLLRAATHAAMGVRDMHMFHNGMATIAHADIKASQFLMPTGSNNFKLNDFNRCRFLTSEDPPEICPFTIGTVHKGSTSRAPEEYLEGGPQTDKIDVFSLGSLIYSMLAGDTPFRGINFKQAQKNIIDGIEPPLPDEISGSNDPNIIVMIETMKWCRQTKAKHRPSSKEVAARLMEALSDAVDRQSNN